VTVLLQFVVELAEAVRLVVGSFAGTGYDPAFLPVGYWNQCIDVGALARQATDFVACILSSK